MFKDSSLTVSSLLCIKHFIWSRIENGGKGGPILTLFEENLVETDKYMYNLSAVWWVAIRYKAVRTEKEGLFKLESQIATTNG